MMRQKRPDLNRSAFSPPSSAGPTPPSLPSGTGGDGLRACLAKAVLLPPGHVLEGDECGKAEARARSDHGRAAVGTEGAEDSDDGCDGGAGGEHLAHPGGVLGQGGPPPAQVRLRQRAAVDGGGAGGGGGEAGREGVELGQTQGDEARVASC